MTQARTTAFGRRQVEPFFIIVTGGVFRSSEQAERTILDGLDLGEEYKYHA